MDRAELKARARAQLGGGIFQNLWMMALAVCLLIGLMESAASGIIPGIGALLVVGPLEYGMAYIFLKQARDHQPVQLGDMFRGFQDDFGGTFLIGLMTAIFTFLWSLLFVIPGIVKAYSYSMALYQARSPRLRLEGLHRREPSDDERPQMGKVRARPELPRLDHRRRAVPRRRYALGHAVHGSGKRAVLRVRPQLPVGDGSVTGEFVLPHKFRTQRVFTADIES